MCFFLALQIFEERRGDVQGGEETLGDIEPDQGDNRRTAGVRFGGQSLQHKDGENEVAAETLSVQPPSPAYALLGNGYFCLEATYSRRTYHYAQGWKVHSQASGPGHVHGGDGRQYFLTEKFVQIIEQKFAQIFLKPKNLCKYLHK